ncbi:hypothetical protein RUL31_03395 [Bacillus atrophaeus]|uniref:hypothetical protein n=1 Tax=Bacillus atrophaeus TaxID=1452 RepID=UPI0028F716CF|nr:hypothetical protein [Bacillus atrophaeus]WNV80369.1 hypothetical protein RUL31_03395 [Bacillus atrophaeus]
MANKNYPHPVLVSYTDDFNPSKAEFDIKVSKRINRMNYELYCDVLLNEDNLQALLDEEKVTFAVKVVCSTTRYRNIFLFRSTENYLTIPASLLEKKVDISTFIVATEQIDNYYSLAFNEDYEDAKFTVFPGDVLAEGSEYTFNIEKKIDPLVKVPSVFTIVYNAENLHADVHSNGEKIIITLNKQDFDKYKQLKPLQNQYGHLAALTSSIFILPALVSVIENIRRELMNLDNDLEAIKDYINDKENDHRWFKVINARLLDEGIKLSEPDNIMESSLVIAQKLLGNPLSNGLQFFDELMAGISSSEEDSV